MGSARPTSRELVQRLGPHPAAQLGLAPDGPEDPGGWFVAACVLSASSGEERGLAATGRLADAGLATPADLLAGGADALLTALEQSAVPRPARLAGSLVRAARTLGERYAGSFDRLAGESDGLDDLGARLAALAPGVGAATVLRFLRPLRGRWSAAADTPLDPAALAAARHLGWLVGGADEDGDPAALRAALAREPVPAAFGDVEAALERLGRRACLRGRIERCPLGEGCPARS